eukprot:6078129-Prymnesium_polylepis.2
MRTVPPRTLLLPLAAAADAALPRARFPGRRLPSSESSPSSAPSSPAASSRCARLSARDWASFDYSLRGRAPFLALPPTEPSAFEAARARFAGRCCPSPAPSPSPSSLAVALLAVSSCRVCLLRAAHGWKRDSGGPGLPQRGCHAYQQAGQSHTRQYLHANNVIVTDLMSSPLRRARILHNRQRPIPPLPFSPLPSHRVGLRVFAS